MTLTRDDLLFGTEFHDESIPCYGARSNRWRRSGKTREWKRNPDRLEVPVKFGMYTSAILTLETSGMHELLNCPVNKERFTQVILNSEEAETVLDIMDDMAAKQDAITSTPPAILSS